MVFEDYKYKLELHAHTSPVSICSQLPVDLFAKKIMGAGYDGVALTNHLIYEYKKSNDTRESVEYYLNDYHKLREAVGHKTAVYLGMEIRFTENINDYLVYGIGEDDIEKAISYLETGIDKFYREFKNDKNVIVQAHPFRSGMVLSNPRSVDGIEVFNMHPGHNSCITRAAKYAGEHKDFLITGGTDYHHEGDEGMFCTLSKYLPRDSYDLARLIKSRDFVFMMSGNIIVPAGNTSIH